MTNKSSERLTVNDARGEARMIRAHLINPAARNLILKTLEDITSENRERLENNYDSATNLNYILYYFVYKKISKLVDENPEVNVIKVLREQPNHQWWYELANILVDADKFIQPTSYEETNEHYAEMTEERFEMALLYAEALGAINDLIGIDEAKELIESLKSIRKELASNATKLNQNPTFQTVFHGANISEVALAILRARLEEEGQEIPVKVFAYLEQLIVSENILSIR